MRYFPPFLPLFLPPSFPPFLPIIHTCPIYSSIVSVAIKCVYQPPGQTTQSIVLPSMKTKLDFFHNMIEEMGHWKPRGCLLFPPGINLTMPQPLVRVSVEYFPCNVCQQHYHDPHNDILASDRPHIYLWSQRIIMEPKIPIA